MEEKEEEIRLNECIILDYVYFSFIFEINIIIQSTLTIMIIRLWLFTWLFQFGCTCCGGDFLTDFVFCDLGCHSNEHIMNVGWVLCWCFEVNKLFLLHKCLYLLVADSFLTITFVTDQYDRSCFICVALHFIDPIALNRLEGLTTSQIKY